MSFQSPHHYLNRYLKTEIQHSLDRKMVFLSGPRQVGKTTLAKELLHTHDFYLNYDFPADKRFLLKHQLPGQKGLIILDEIHKMRGWRNLIKGYFDKFFPDLKILVTGSARLDHYRKGGDSLQGRYRHFRLHPLSVKELNLSSTDELRKLLSRGGFPEPYFADSAKESNIWRNDYFTRVFREDISALENIREISLLEQLMVRLPDLVGSPLSINSLREDLEVAHHTIDRWLNIFESCYVIYRLLPFGPPRIKAVKKERKHYHYDWSWVEDEGSRFENLVASHLLKWIHFQHDVEGRLLELRFFRDQEGREVDFVIEERKKPILFVECKLRNKQLHTGLRYLKRKFPQVRAVQVGLESDRLVVDDGIEFCNAVDFLRDFI
ncbi:MAG: AAA family ATPase [Bdellovibrio sp.]|nr:MAG: AAA family ATPase [Bdellovibrio sp.]